MNPFNIDYGFFFIFLFQVKEVGILLGLMCKYSCEDCTMIIYGDQGVHRTVELESGTILDNMGSVLELARVSRPSPLWLYF